MNSASAPRPHLPALHATLRELLGLVVLLLAAAAPAHARMALVVGEPFGAFGWMMPQGHAGIYLSNLCVDTPTHLRPCRAGELGAVISRYHDLRHPELDWMAFPLPVFLYGSPGAVEDPSTIPAFITAPTKRALREQYRAAYLAETVPELPDQRGQLHPPPYGDWEEGIGSAFDRRLLVYEFDTTAAEDHAALNWLNDRPNRRAYTLGRHNCADFAADLLRLVLPGSALRRNRLADFDMTTPKTLAREVDAYGRSHPELHLAVYEVPQLSGTLPRSKPLRGAAQSLLTNRLYLCTLLVLQPEIIAASAIIYEKRGKWTPGLDAKTMQPAAWPSASLGSSASAATSTLALP